MGGPWGGGLVAECWSLKVSATCQCISGTDLLVHLRDGSVSTSQGWICQCISGTDLLVHLRDRSVSVSQG